MPQKGVRENRTMSETISRCGKICIRKRCPTPADGSPSARRPMGSRRRKPRMVSDTSRSSCGIWKSRSNMSTNGHLECRRNVNAPDLPSTRPSAWSPVWRACAASSNNSRWSATRPPTAASSASAMSPRARGKQQAALPDEGTTSGRHAPPSSEARKAAAAGKGMGAPPSIMTFAWARNACPPSGAQAGSSALAPRRCVWYRS
mmetsp:Transcript_33735/g.93189  ORF Transcript_33735/g.93189 Transcript_33735/m.93189 type:complete len:203 (-) Transcript_33735:652-1260(-)